MKIAIIHYWLITWRGGEKVLEQILNAYPDADIYTNVYDDSVVKKHLPNRKLYTTFINRMPLSKKLYQKYIALMPFALEQLDLTKYDLIISTESGPAKNVIIDPDAIHICYCHSPMRYVWDMYHIYQKNAGFLTRLLMKPLIHYLKIVDALSANRVDYFIANSNFTARRIEKSYRRKSEVIFPPVSQDEFILKKSEGNYYLYLGQLTVYKKADIALEAFKKSGKNLVVIGEGELEYKFKSLNLPNIKFLGKQPFIELKKYLSDARALVFPGVEDFGIVPLEAISSGTPVIAYGKGGVLDTVQNKVTGILFDTQNADSLNQAILEFEKIEDSFDLKTMREHASKYSNQRFVNEFVKFVDSKLKSNPGNNQS